jgi:hypothetical protein
VQAARGRGPRGQPCGAASRAAHGSAADLIHVTLHDFSPTARFYRAFYDSMFSVRRAAPPAARRPPPTARHAPQVLYYSAWKGVVPVFICTPFRERQYYDEASRATYFDADEDVQDFLFADQQEACDGNGARVLGLLFAALVILFLLLGPAFGFRRIQHDERRRSARLRRTEYGAAEHRHVDRHPCLHFLQAMFIGAPRTRQMNEDELEAWEEDYDDHLLREPFSVLYAMNHQVFYPLIHHTAHHIKRVIRE